MIKYSYYFFLPFNTFLSAKEAYEFVLHCVRFKIEQIRSDISFNPMDWYEEEQIAQKLGGNNDQKFTLAGKIETHEDFEKIIYRKEPNKKLEVFIIDISDKENFDIDGFLLHLNDIGFTNGYSINWLKAQWQSQAAIHQFKTFKKNLPQNYRTKRDKTFGEIIDTFYNPGHVGNVLYMNLYAAPEMWFGTKSLDFFEKRKLLSFPNALEIKELAPNLIYIKLFNYDEPDWETPKILGLQRLFRGWTDMDKIEKLLIFKNE